MRSFLPPIEKSVPFELGRNQPPITYSFLLFLRIIRALVRGTLSSLTTMDLQLSKRGPSRRDYPNHSFRRRAPAKPMILFCHLMKLH